MKMVEPKSCAKNAGAAEAAVMHSLGVSAFQRGKVETALKFISRACAHPEAPAVWHRNHAEILDRRGNSKGAEAAARLALSRDPNYAEAWETLGTILVQRGKHAESCACYEKAVEINPNFVQALNNLAVILDRCPNSTRAHSIAMEFIRELKRQTRLERKRKTSAPHALSMSA